MWETLPKGVFEVNVGKEETFWTTVQASWHAWLECRAEAAGQQSAALKAVILRYLLWSLCPFHKTATNHPILSLSPDQNL